MNRTTIAVSFTLTVFLFTFGWIQAAQGDATAGQDAFKSICTNCHGEEGKGDGKASKMLKPKPGDWSDGSTLSDYSDEDLFKLIKDGGEAAGKSKLMPANGKKLTDDQINDVIAFIKSLQG